MSRRAANAGLTLKTERCLLRFSMLHRNKAASAVYGHDDSWK